MDTVDLEMDKIRMLVGFLVFFAAVPSMPGRRGRRPSIKVATVLLIMRYFRRTLSLGAKTETAPGP